MIECLQVHAHEVVGSVACVHPPYMETGGVKCRNRYWVMKPD